MEVKLTSELRVVEPRNHSVRGALSGSRNLGTKHTPWVTAAASTDEGRAHMFSWEPPKSTLSAHFINGPGEAE